MTDISELTSLITALRAEQQTDSISPESLGSLLQRILDLIAGRVSDAQIADLTTQINNIQDMAQCNEDDIGDIQTELGSLADQLEDFIAEQDDRTPYHIECKVINKRLYLRGNIAELLEKGYYPYIFRYSKKQHKLCRSRDDHTRIRGPVMKGWHMFEGNEMITVEDTENGKNEVLIKKVFNAGPNGVTRTNYRDEPERLFKTPRQWYDDLQDMYRYSVTYGKRQFEITETTRRFKFAIAFGTFVKKGQTFKWEYLRTNLATVYIKVEYNLPTDEIFFRWSL